MKIEIGQAIARLRREQGVTQERLAEAVGVSAPAVSKWETGQSYPDIMLLPPLARFFGVTVDVLLAYTPKLTEEELEAINKELQACFANEGFAAGLARCDALARAYPKDAKLRILLYGALMQAGVYCKTDEQREIRAARQDAWLADAAESSDKETHVTARQLLGIHYLQQNRLEEAETILTELAALDLNARQLMPTLRMRQERYDDAERLAQRNLLMSFLDVLSSLSMLTSVAVKQEDAQKAARYAEAGELFTKPLGLLDIFSVQVSQAQMTAAHAAQDDDALLAATERYISGVLSSPRFSQSPLFSLVGSGEPASSPHLAALSETLYNDLGTNPNYEALRGHPRFEAILTRLRDTFTD